MKKMRKLLALLLVAVMALTGCKKEKATMFTVMEDAESMTKYSYEITAEIESTISGMEEAAIVLKGETDGERTSLGFEVDYLFFSLEVEELLIVDKNAAYINAPEILSLAESYIGYNVEDMIGMELNWIEIPFAEGVTDNSNAEEISKLMRSIYEVALAENEMVSKDGTHTVTIDSLDELITFMENFAEAINDNKDELIKLSEGQDTEAAVEAVKETVGLYMDSMVAAIEKFGEDYELDILDEDIEELKAQVDAALENLELNTDVEDTMDTAFEEMDEAFATAVEELENLDEDSASIDITVSNSMTGKAGSREYSVELVVEIADEETDDELKLTVESVMVEDDDLKVKLPKDITTLEDIVYGILEFAYNSGMLNMGELGMGDVPVEPETVEPTTEEPTTEEPSSEIEIVRPTESETEEGVVALIDYYNEKYVANVTYDPEMVVVDLEYSDLEQGDACFNLATDEWTYIFLGTYDAEDAEEYKDFLVEFYASEDVGYTNVEATDITEKVINGLTFDTYQVSYSDSGYDYVEDCFVLELADEFVIAGESSCFEGSPVLSFEEMLSYIFVDVEVVEADGSDIVIETESGAEDDTTASGEVENITIDHVAKATDTVRFYGWESVLDLTFDSDMVQLDESWCAPETGDLCIELVDDSSTYMFIYANNNYATFEEYYEWQTSYYDSDYYSNVEISDIYNLYVGNVIINRFDVSYDNGVEQYFFLSLGNGESIYGDSDDFASGYAEGTMDDFLSYVFVELAFGEGIAPSQIEYDGTVEITCPSDNSTYVITYDTEKVAVNSNPAYTYAPNGKVGFEYLEDTLFTTISFELAEYATAQELCDDIVDMNDYYYDSVTPSEITEIVCGDITVNVFDIVYKSGDYEYGDQYCVVELGNGYVLCGDSQDFYDEYAEISLEEMLGYIFVDFK